MPDTYTQAEQPLRVTTALGPDKLLLTGFTGTEALSQLFRFALDLAAPGPDPIDFSGVLGQPAAIELDLLKDQGTRYFHGIISRVSQGRRDAEFITYRAELVPKAWLLTLQQRSRIFQHVSVPDILKKVLEGLETDFQIEGTFEPRDYCVQYRESDWAFACRMMEEEGIYYFFTHEEGGAKLVLANTSRGHPDVPGPTELIYDEVAGGNRDEDRVWEWEKVQEVVSGKVTLWDHCFELPGQNLEALSAIADTVTAGTVDHKLLPNGEALEVYDYPGDYAGRFDGVDRGGGDKPSDVQKIFEDNRRTVGIRMQQVAAQALRASGGGNCGQLTAGHKFTLTGHFDADGGYVLTQVSHAARIDSYRSGNSPFDYSNTFECLPLELPFRPQRVTPRPFVRGAQTATVVGPGGEEIFTDKYGRVKVQFHWDREGKQDADSSCWIRVGTPWAGQNWGMISIPRIGQEVIVTFLEGDPDQPIVVGSVYNADQMPPWGLPANRTQSGILSRSSLGGSGANANAIRFEDKKGSEQLWLHAEKNQDIEVENDETHWVGHDRKKTVDNDETTHVKHDRTETVDNNETITVHGARTETVDKDETITIHANRTETVDLNETLTVSGHQSQTIAMTQTTAIGLAHTVTVGAVQAITVALAQTVTVGASQAVTVGGGQTNTVGKDLTETVGGGNKQTVAKDQVIGVGGGRSATVGKDDSLKVTKKLVVDAGEEILIKTGKAELLMKKDGTIALKGKDILIDGTGKITVKASKDLTLKGSKIGEN